MSEQIWVLMQARPHLLAETLHTKVQKGIFFSLLTAVEMATMEQTCEFEAPERDIKLDINDLTI